MTVLGWILLLAGAVTAFGNLTGGGLVNRAGASGRLVFALVIAAIGAGLIWGRG